MSFLSDVKEVSRLDRRTNYSIGNEHRVTAANELISIKELSGLTMYPDYSR